ncbi:hypothetical protein J2S46_000465 [Kitasatospora herbaricolor]|uniref:hypothetical protein n=1 Tax=Kitasatospora herbaricolor TaxID=68217 RepID=UPI00278E39DC|nr:hypothetical protein [Kitasatospora herbaricolor]MDQ0305909.1 hypothetical protein [Kitasatospora herbaricolor]
MRRYCPGAGCRTAQALQFASLHAALLRALPHHRDELEQIAALARPLLPPGMQPAQLDQPQTGPVPALTADCWPSISSLSTEA